MDYDQRGLSLLWKEGKMIYPEFIKKGDYIGVTAPSAGITEEGKLKRLDNGIKNIKNIGFNYIETPNVRTDVAERSSSAKQRAEEFMSLLNKREIKSIILAAGGYYEAEVLEYLDFQKMRNMPKKWIQGYSDSTNLTFLTTTLLDTASIYCDNFGSYGMRNLARNLTDSIELMKGNEIVQESFEKYQTERNDYNIDPYAEYKLEKEVKWKNLRNEAKIKFEGRALGGCFDVLVNLIGTKYDKVKEFIEKYKEDGVVWYFDICDMVDSAIFLHLLQFKNAGYFKNCKGIIFGRVANIREDLKLSLEEIIEKSIGSLNIPIILDSDIGHVGPQLAIVNGAIINVTSENGKGIVVTKLK